MLMRFYMEGLILGVNTMYMLFCFFKLFLIGCIGLKKQKPCTKYQHLVLNLPYKFLWAYGRRCALLDTIGYIGLIH